MARGLLIPRAMFTNHRSAFGLAVMTAGLSASLVGTAGAAAAYQYSLSDFGGTLPFGDALLYVDRGRDELYVADGYVLRVFNNQGMEVHRFENYPELGHAKSLAVDENGNLLVLLEASQDSADGGRVVVSRRNYRGEPKDEIEIRGLPDGFAGFLPDALFYRNGKIILASRGQFLVVVAEPTGAFEKGFDLAKLLGIAPDQASGPADLRLRRGLLPGTSSSRFR